jgi:hypothetical protein
MKKVLEYRSATKEEWERDTPYDPLFHPCNTHDRAACKSLRSGRECDCGCHSTDPNAAVIMSREDQETFNRLFGKD